MVVVALIAALVTYFSNNSKDDWFTEAIKVFLLAFLAMMVLMLIFNFIYSCCGFSKKQEREDINRAMDESIEVINRHS